MKTLVESLKASFNESLNISFNKNFETAKSSLLQGSDVMMKFLNSPSKLNKYFKEFDVDKEIKMNVYNLLAELASDLYTWMNDEDTMDIEEDGDMIAAWENREENAVDDYEDEEIEKAFEIWPKLWKDVVKFEWVW